MIYLFTDGFADQSGGPREKKFMRKAFRDMLVEISDGTPEAQLEALQTRFTEWTGDLQQTDDVCVLGIRIV